MTFHPGVSTHAVITPSPDVMIVCRQVLSLCAKLLLIDRCHRLEAMRQRYAEDEERWVQQHIVVHSIFRKDSTAICEAEGNKLRKLKG